MSLQEQKLFNTGQNIARIVHEIGPTMRKLAQVYLDNSARYQSAQSALANASAAVAQLPLDIAALDASIASENAAITSGLNSAYDGARTTAGNGGQAAFRTAMIGVLQAVENRRAFVAEKDQKTALLAEAQQVVIDAGEYIQRMDTDNVLYDNIASALNVREMAIDRLLGIINRNGGSTDQQAQIGPGWDYVDAALASLGRDITRAKINARLLQIKNYCDPLRDAFRANAMTLADIANEILTNVPGTDQDESAPISQGFTVEI